MVFKQDNRLIGFGSLKKETNRFLRGESVEVVDQVDG